MKKTSLYWQTYLNLEKEMVELSQYVFFTDKQLEVYSPYVADLIVRTCIQIESISKDLYFEIGGEKRDNLYFDTDCLKLLDRTWNTSCKSVLIVATFWDLKIKSIKPLKEAHKNGDKAASWEKSYQAIKHDRYNNLYKGSIKAFLYALAALYLLNIYYMYYCKNFYIGPYKNLSQLNYSFGSSIFAVQKPAIDENQILDRLVLTPRIEKNESPFIVKYKDDDYKELQNIQKNINRMAVDYWRSQPEINDEECQSYLKNIKKEWEDNYQYFNPFWGLEQYRLHKLVLSNGSFEEKKKRLLASEQWKVYAQEKKEGDITPNDITIKNIQNVVDQIAIRAGIALENQLQQYSWVTFLSKQPLYEVCIPKVNNKNNIV